MEILSVCFGLWSSKLAKKKNESVLNTEYLSDPRKVFIKQTFSQWKWVKMRWRNQKYYSSKSICEKYYYPRKIINEMEVSGETIFLSLLFSSF